MAKITFAQEQKRRLFSARETVTILRVRLSLISRPGGVSAAAVMRALYAGEEGERLIERIRASLKGYYLFALNHHILWINKKNHLPCIYFSNIGKRI